MKKSGGKMVSHPGDDESVRVLAHTRKKPARNAEGPERIIPGRKQNLGDQLADNAFMGLRETGTHSPITGGLAGEPAVNHLKAAVGLLNRKRT